jgi:sortase A
MKKIQISKRNILKALVLMLELLAVGLIIYLIALPFYPVAKYKLIYENTNTFPEAQDVEKAKEQVAEFKGVFPETEYAVSPHRLIISKIGVNAPIIVTESAEYGLHLGAWHIPESSTPNKGGNTVITGHRFKYLPPNNMTFYLFHKLEVGDIVSVIWHEKDYFYKIKEIKIVDKTDFSILEPSEKPILTLFTCHPIYSTENRLVVIGELIEG